MNRNDKVYGQKGTDFEKVAGIVTGGKYRCRVECCKGHRIGVRWPDGKITYPCSTRIIEEGRHFRID